MPWFAIDDSAHTHPKIVRAGNSAFGLWVRCGSYASQHLTDGIVPGVIASMYGTAPQIRKLIQVGLWHEHGHNCPSPKCLQPSAGDFAIHDFLVYNHSRKEVTARREREAAKKRRQRGGSDSQRNRDGIEDESQTNRERFEDDSSSKNNGHYDNDAGQGDVSPRDSLGTRARAFPSPPLPSPTGGVGRERTAGSGGRANEPSLSQIPADWKPTGNDLDAAREDLDRLGAEGAAAATAKFVRHHQAKAITAADFGPLWVNWISNERTPAPEPAQGAFLVPLPGGGQQPMTRGQKQRAVLTKLREQRAKGETGS